MTGLKLTTALFIVAAPAAYAAPADDDPQAWYESAQAARAAGELDAARDALAKATELGLSPVRAGFERARIHVVDDQPAAAVAELQALADGGFTALGAITGDPVLATLAGEPAFDDFVAALAPQAYPCDHQERFRAFDFWLGDWDVHTADGTYAGHNTITASERGCVLLEHWQGAGGGSGMSINYLDAASGNWVQVWNSESGAQIDIRGSLQGDSMVLNGHIHYIGNGTTAPFRGTWTRLPDGRVRQFFEQSNDAGETWTPWFEGFYTRSEPAAEGSD